MKPLNKITLIISGGGTGGHISPAIAIAQQFIQQHPDAVIHYIGKTGGREEQVIAQSGLPLLFHGISAQGIPRRISPAIFTALYQTLLGLRQAMKLVKQIKPNAVIGTGGYVSVSAVFAAQLKKIPTLVHEPDAFPGMTNRFLGKRAKYITTSYQELERYFPAEKIKVTGNPIRSQFGSLDKANGLKRFELESGQVTILVTGGSQGAMSLNKFTAKAFKILDKENLKIQVIFQTGDKSYPEIIQETAGLKNIKVIVKPYIENMADAYAAADLVISRSGAMSISEITYCGLPAILVPYPYATANHQEKNARSVESKGAAKVILEKEISPELMASTIQTIIGEAEVRMQMAERSRAMSYPDAARNICQLIESMCKQD